MPCGGHFLVRSQHAMWRPLPCSISACYVEATSLFNLSMPCGGHFLVRSQHAMWRPLPCSISACHVEATSLFHLSMLCGGHFLVKLNTRITLRRFFASAFSCFKPVMQLFILRELLGTSFSELSELRSVLSWFGLHTSCEAPIVVALLDSTVHSALCVCPSVTITVMKSSVLAISGGLPTSKTLTVHSTVIIQPCNQV